MENIKKNIENDNVQISFEYNGETFVYPKSVLDIIKLYKGEMSYDEFYNKYKNHFNFTIYNGLITICSLLQDSRIYLNSNGTNYYFFKQNNNLTLENFLENCKDGLFNKGDGIIVIKENIRTEIACILHFLENENNLEQFKTSVELPNIGIKQQNPETGLIVEGNKGKIGKILESKNKSFEVSGNGNIKIGINGEIEFKGKLTDKEKIRELNIFIGILLKQAKDNQDIKEIIKIISKIDKLNIERKKIKDLDIKTKNLDLVEQAIEKLKKEKTNKEIKSEPKDKNGGVKNFSKDDKSKLNDEHKKEIISNSDNGIQESLEKSVLEGEQVIRKINEYKERIIKLKEKFERLIGDKKNIKELKLNKEKIELIEKIINAIKTLNKAKKELESKIKNKNDNYNEKNDPIKKLITDFENILKELRKNNK